MNWLIENVPFVVLFAAGVVLVVVAWRLLGIKGAFAALAFLGTVLLYRSGRQDARADQVTKDRANADHAVKEASAARIDAAVRDADPDRLRETDGFRRD